LTGLLLFDIIIRQASSTNRLRRQAHIGTDRKLIEAGAADASSPLDATLRQSIVRPSTTNFSRIFDPTFFIAL